MTLRITKEQQRKAAERYRLVGVHCVSCKRVIENELAKIEGIEKAEVDPNTGSLTLVFSDGVDRARIVEAVRKVGYDIVLEKVILKAEGLREGMGPRIVRSLKSLPGVVDARVFEANKLIRVEFDPLQTSREELIETFGELGLRVELGGEEKKLDTAKISLALSSLSAAIFLGGLTLGIEFLALIGGLAAFVVAFYEFIIPATKAALRGYLIMDTLLALGTGVAFGLSLYGYFLGGPVYFEAVVFITLFVVAGRYVEERLRHRAEEILSESRDILPDKARVERGGMIVEVPESEVKPGEIVVVRAGERLPVDGRIASGEGEIDESPVTGESIPRQVGEGDLVLAGSTLVRGWLRITALRTGEYRLVARALEAAREAGLYRPRLQELADRVVSVFVPSVLLVATATIAGHLILGSTLATALIAAATVLVVACPCALGIAIPTAIAASVARAHRMGIILKRPDTLEPLSKAGIVAFDKTGTLTRGKPVVVDAKPVEGDLSEALKLAATLEAESNHPIAKAIVEYYNEKIAGSLGKLESMDEVPGTGLLGTVDGHNVAVGGIRLLEELGVEEPDVDVEGLTRVYIVVDGNVKAVLGLEDEVKEEARRVIAELSRRGIEAYILSGDSPNAVKRIASKLGIPEERALGGLDPLKKAEIISNLKQKKTVAFVGDGVNDGPALAEADIGFAVNEALDVARQAGDMVMAKNDLRLLTWAIELARKAARTIRFNLFWAFAYNVILIPIAAGALSPLGLVIRPELAALAMSLSSITVTSNSARILYWKPKL